MRTKVLLQDTWDFLKGISVPSQDQWRQALLVRQIREKLDEIEASEKAAEAIREQPKDKP